ncbi:hypothetical protein CGRA01v4_04566 [Colletotrichum graminicola]|nr:hypothetical protein CGRA01v4_04566 [Colletotrichum graminicola]
MIWICVGFISLCLWDLKSAVGLRNPLYAVHSFCTPLKNNYWISPTGGGRPVSRRDNVPLLT